MRRAKRSGDEALDRRQLVVNDEVNDKLVRRTGIQSAVAASLCRRTPKSTVQPREDIVLDLQVGCLCALHNAGEAQSSGR